MQSVSLAQLIEYNVAYVLDAGAANAVLVHVPVVKVATNGADRAEVLGL